MPKPKPIPKPEPLPRPDGLRVVLRPAGGTGASAPVTAITEHGLEIPVYDLAQLVRMLQAQADNRKKVTLTGDQFPLVLAAWQRIGPMGAGKIEKPPLGSGPRPNELRPRRFTQSGRPLPSLDDLLNA